jgi:hypothetical protein
LNPLILIVDDEPNVEVLFASSSPRFAHSPLRHGFRAVGDDLIAEAKASLILILFDVNMPGRLSAQGSAGAARCSADHFPELRVEIDRRIEATTAPTGLA